MLKRLPASVSDQEVAAAISETEALASIRKSKPSVEDYVAEGVLDATPEENAEGQIDVQVNGHDRVVRMLQMNEEFYRKESEHFDARRSSGRKASWREAHEETRARKFHRPRTSIIVPEMPWKRRRRRKESD